MRQPSYRLHKPSGLGFIEIQGKRHYLGEYGTSQSLAKFGKKLAEYLSSGCMPESPKQEPGVTCTVLAFRFLQFAATRYVKNGKPTSETRAFTTALSAVTELYGDEPAADFSPLKLMAARQVLINRGYCRLKINSHVGRIRRVWKWAVSREIVPETVWRALNSVEGLRKGEAPDRPKVRPVLLDRVTVIESHVSPVVWGLIQLQLHTGCRPGEACSIRMCDLRMVDDVWEYTPDSHKTEHHDRERVVYIGPRGQAAIRSFLRTDTHTPLFSPQASKEWHQTKRRNGKPVKNRKRRPKRAPGSHFCAGSLGHSIRAACLKAKVAPWTPNQLRHVAATTIRAQFNLESSRVVLGHSDASTSAIYAEQDREKARDVARRIG